MKKLTIVIVDDHQLVREMWGKIFSANETLEIVAESGELSDALEKIKKVRPDIVMLDINLANSSGMDAIPVIRSFSPGTKIIGLSMHNEPAYAKEMLKMGAKAYVTKNSSYNEIMTAIKMVMEGKIFVCSEIKDILLNKELGNDDVVPDLRSLSMREMEITRLLKKGKTSKEIAAMLSISIRTVEVHRHNILKKLKLKNVAQLVYFISRHQLE